MGAMAISALTGTALIAQTPSAGFMAELLPFMRGFTVFFLGYRNLVDPDVGDPGLAACS
jgi:hypothetical protein